MYYHHSEEVFLHFMEMEHKDGRVLDSNSHYINNLLNCTIITQSGYPYIKAEDIKGDLEELFSKNQENEPSENDSILLMTHVGPSGSTTIDQEEGADKHIYAGSDILKEFLQKQVAYCSLLEKIDMLNNIIFSSKIEFS